MRFFFHSPIVCAGGLVAKGKRMAVEKAFGKAGHAERSVLYKKNTVDGKLFLLNFSIRLLFLVVWNFKS